MKKILMTLILLFVVGSSGMSMAGTIGFEGMPELYQYGYGHQNFGDYWEGVFFGPDSTVLDKNWPLDSYNYPGYPPHSGDAVLFSYSTPYIDAIFDNPVPLVSMWYTSTSDFVIDAYDVNGILIGSQSGGSNYGTNSYIEIAFNTDSIKRLRMHDTGNFFTVDDFTADIVTGNPKGVPEPATLFLLGSGLIGLAALRKKKFIKKQG